ncbi:hypothetical protein [Streptomyces sp. NPDC090994]|uniref:hypothetical protein n=1 Tax=Streptomyces sp. NPDC090994 TaxID=3365969 RepID=UPI0038084AD9
MSAPGPGSGGTPDEVWQKFLMDSEDAIRASAPREPSARDRTPGWLPAPVAAEPAEAVGELWQPDDPEPEPAWRDLDGRARFRRAARVLATAAAVVLALTVWSQLTGSETPSGGPGDSLVERVEEAPATLPTAAPAPASLPASAPATAWTVG